MKTPRVKQEVIERDGSELMAWLHDIECGDDFPTQVQILGTNGVTSGVLARVEVSATHARYTDGWQSLTMYRMVQS